LSRDAFWEVYEGATAIVGAEGSCQNATLSGYEVGPNKEYAEAESCCIESRKPDKVWV
jgi:hypothetical protein